MSNLSLTEWVDLVARPWDSESLTVSDQMELLVPDLIDHHQHQEQQRQQESPNRRDESERTVTKNLKKVRVENSQRCAICLEEFSVGSEACCGEGCSHVFHDRCIGRWLEKNSSCPLCRHKMMALPS